MVPNRFTNAETSWRRESVWKYEVMFEGGLRTKRTEGFMDSSNRSRTAASGSGHGSGLETAAIIRKRSAAVDSGQCVTAAETAATGSGQGSGRRDLAREDHGFLSGLINTV